MRDRRRRGLGALCAWALLLGLAGPARAQQRDEEAKTAYLEGKRAYEARHYEEALEQFKRSYTLSGQPALLYNISSTHQQLNHPGPAAEALRDYLKARPNDPDRADLESRIASLENAQQLIDRDEKERQRIMQQQRAERDRANALLAVPGWLSESEADRRLVLVKERERKRRRALGFGLGFGLGAVVVGAAAVLIVCTTTTRCTPEGPRDYDYAKATVTP